MLPPDTIIFGVGNIFIGDDGFGPTVIQTLNEKRRLPHNVQAIDIGTSIRDHLFDYLLAEKLRPKQIIIVDSVNIDGHQPGDVFTIELNEIPANKQHDYSLHQFPTVNMLKELHQFTNISITIIVVQISREAKEIGSRLSKEVQRAIPQACYLVHEHIIGCR